MQRAVITGVAGFIGSHLADSLLERGCSVVGIDNLLTGSLANIRHLRDREFEFIEHDVTRDISVAGPVDLVLHWASPASPVDYLELPIPTLKVGALGTHNALGLAKAKGARFVLASTSEVYGDPLEHPQRESYWGNVNPVGPRGVYDEAKRFAEAITTAYHRYHGLDAKIVRIFNTYGPRMRLQDGRAIPNFITQALRGEDVTVYGDGEQTRSFCFIRDLVRGIIALAESDVNEPVNLGNPAEMTIREIADAIISATGSRSRIVRMPLPTDDPKVRQPDITRARTLLGWEPDVSLAEGLGMTIDYFRSRVATAGTSPQGELTPR
ncbi:MAG: SDR family oxidoreductase [Acidobacteria bacterium]|nr:SDR family oxidoreductase [Acidobacteriota bacterium]